VKLAMLHDAPPPELARALAAFETQFVYPLGPGRSFRIDHGDDYARFFRAMGEAVCCVAQRDGVLGTLGAAVRCLLHPDGSAHEALYLGDLKIAPAARGGRTLLQLARCVEGWARPRVESAFSVVMDGTAATPLRYTGRLGLPAFAELGKVIVLRLATSARAAAESGQPQERGSACYRELSAGRYAAAGGNPRERSHMEPCWLLHPDGRACGRLEDTRRAKRLYSDDGSEMLSAHFSCFAFRDTSAGAALLEAALGHAHALGFPALFVAVAPPDAGPLCARLAATEIVSAGATIYGTGLAPGPLWNINTAEI
jgi:hypothetical protein